MADLAGALERAGPSLPESVPDDRMGAAPDGTQPSVPAPRSAEVRMGEAITTGMPIDLLPARHGHRRGTGAL